ncbi:MAG TPA: hypothetical protein VHC90_11050 [Bryobacteraceae bacterium]|nr:hypothetical protein [Bryobacteraceae bacterium]
MADDGNVTPQPISEPPMRGKRGQFAPGHKRIFPSTTPRKVIKSWNARRIMEEYGFDPIVFLIRVATEGKIPGTIQKVPVEERIKAAKELARYGHPTLSATHVTTAHESEDNKRADLDVVMSDPALVEQAQALSLAMTERMRPERALPPANDEVILDGETEDVNPQT